MPMYQHVQRVKLSGCMLVHHLQPHYGGVRSFRALTASLVAKDASGKAAYPAGPIDLDAAKRYLKEQDDALIRRAKQELATLVQSVNEKVLPELKRISEKYTTVQASPDIPPWENARFKKLSKELDDAVGKLKQQAKRAELNLNDLLVEQFPDVGKWRREFEEHVRQMTPEQKQQALLGFKLEEESQRARLKKYAEGRNRMFRGEG